MSLKPDLSFFPQWFSQSVAPQKETVATSVNNFRKRITPCDYDLSFDRVNAPVLALSKTLKQALNSGERILLAFDFDGTLTDTKCPDFSVIADIPENIAKALEKIAAHPQFRVRIITARGHDSIHHVNLDQEIKRYSSDGQIKAKHLGLGKLELEIEAGKVQYFKETQKIKNTITKDPILGSLVEDRTVAIATGLGNLAININSEFKGNKHKLDKKIKERMNFILQGSHWEEWTKFKEENNIFYYSKELYERAYEYKASGIRRIVSDLQEESFSPNLIACFGDSPIADTSMMKEVQSWNSAMPLYNSINVAVGSRIPKEESSITHRLKSHRDVYELILAIANNLNN